jgi:hypothetical protein
VAGTIAGSCYFVYMIKNIYEARAVIVEKIRDLLFEMADGDYDSVDPDLLKTYFGQLADKIVESIGLTIIDIKDGVVIASLLSENPIISHLID